MKQFRLYIIFLFIVYGYLPLAFAQEKLYAVAPTVLLHTTREMKTPGFWISRHSNPDTIVLDNEEIEEFNQKSKASGLILDIFKIPGSQQKGGFKREFELAFKEFGSRELYQHDGQKADAGFYDAVLKNMNLEPLPDTISNSQYGFIVKFSDQRFFPTVQGLYAIPGDYDFDELQNSDLDAGTPVSVWHESLDGQWLYVESDISLGWVKKENVALCDKKDIEEFLKIKKFIVITSPKADSYSDKYFRQTFDYVRMGVRLPLIDKGKDFYAVRWPIRNADGRCDFLKAYIKKENAHAGFLSYTPRHTIEQAFQLLDAPYGWGGANGEQDCSRFLQEVFATVGISLPRDSKNQKLTGQLLAQFDENTADQQKLEALQKATGGITILPMKGHIMLYLGMVDSRPYAIHAVWAYREPDGKEDRVRVINRVVVSDLSLGEGSKKGSLLRRLSKIVQIDK